jgi:hypothetical protein
MWAADGQATEDAAGGREGTQPVSGPNWLGSGASPTHVSTSNSRPREMSSFRMNHDARLWPSRAQKKKNGVHGDRKLPSPRPNLVQLLSPGRSWSECPGHEAAALSFGRSSSCSRSPRLVGCPTGHPSNRRVLITKLPKLHSLRRLELRHVPLVLRGGEAGRAAGLSSRPPTAAGHRGTLQVASARPQRKYH